ERLFGIDKLNVVRSEIPAVTHVDYSARIQTVHAETNPRYHALLSAFKRRTGCSVLVNTSFNVCGEPIVCSPEDAFRCFMGTEIEMLAIGNCLLWKKEQDPALARTISLRSRPIEGSWSEHSGVMRPCRGICSMFYRGILNLCAFLLGILL